MSTLIRRGVFASKAVFQAFAASLTAEAMKGPEISMRNSSALSEMYSDNLASVSREGRVKNYRRQTTT
jgi:hypothetical protein